jgi:cytochrome c biogenesis protein CcdA
MQGWVVAWYAWLSQLTQGPILVIDGWIRALDAPPVTALLFGLIGATSPCQLTTNLGALAFGARQAGATSPLAATLAYTVGKIVVYSVIGGAVILLGSQLQAASIPVIVLARKLLGPLMMLVGLGMLRLIRLRGATGRALSERLRALLPEGGGAGPFLLGVAFSFAFCPTLFWLFFGLTLPLAIRNTGGWSFPALFAVGTTLPLLVIAAALGLGSETAERVAGGMARAQRAARLAAGSVLVLAGLHDTVIYWWL